MFTRMPRSTDIFAARKPSRRHGYLIYAFGIHEYISSPWTSICSAVVSKSAKTSIDTPAFPTSGEIALTIVLYSFFCSDWVSFLPDASLRWTSGFLATNVGLVVWPSRKPRSFLMRNVSSGSPPSRRILASGRFAGELVIAFGLQDARRISVSVRVLATGREDAEREFGASGPASSSTPTPSRSTSSPPSQPPTSAVTIAMKESVKAAALGLAGSLIRFNQLLINK